MSNVPPTWSQPPAPKKKFPVWGWVLIAVSPCLLCGIGAVALVGAGAGVISQQRGDFTCAWVAANLNEAVLEYARANGEFPAANSWLTDVKSIYDAKNASLPDQEVFGLSLKLPPLDASIGCELPDGKASYLLYNADLAGTPIGSAQTRRAVIFESATAAESGAKPYGVPTTEPLFPTADGERGIFIGDTTGEFVLFRDPAKRHVEIERSGGRVTRASINTRFGTGSTPPPPPPDKTMSGAKP